jgi:hypothetical protein
LPACHLPVGRFRGFDTMRVGGAPRSHGEEERRRASSMGVAGIRRVNLSCPFTTWICGPQVAVRQFPGIPEGFRRFLGTSGNTPGLGRRASFKNFGIRPAYRKRSASIP